MSNSTKLTVKIYSDNNKQIKKEDFFFSSIIMQFEMYAVISGFYQQAYLHCKEDDFED